MMPGVELIGDSESVTDNSSTEKANDLQDVKMLINETLEQIISGLKRIPPSPGKKKMELQLSQLMKVAKSAANDLPKLTRVGNIFEKFKLMTEVKLNDIGGDLGRSPGDRNQWKKLVYGHGEQEQSTEVAVTPPTDIEDINGVGDGTDYSRDEYHAAKTDMISGGSIDGFNTIGLSDAEQRKVDVPQRSGTSPYELRIGESNQSGGESYSPSSQTVRGAKMDSAIPHDPKKAKFVTGQYRPKKNVKRGGQKLDKDEMAHRAAIDGDVSDTDGSDAALYQEATRYGSGTVEVLNIDEYDSV